MKRITSAGHQAKLEQHDRDILAGQAERQALADTIQRQEAKIERLKELGVGEEGLAAYRTEVDQLAARLLVCDDSIAALESWRGIVDGKLATHTDQLAGLRTDVTSIREDIAKVPFVILAVVGVIVFVAMLAIFIFIGPADMPIWAKVSVSLGLGSFFMWLVAEHYPKKAIPVWLAKSQVKPQEAAPTGGSAAIEAQKSNQLTPPPAALDEQDEVPDSTDGTALQQPVTN